MKGSAWLLAIFIFLFCGCAEQSAELYGGAFSASVIASGGNCDAELQLKYEGLGNCEFTFLDSGSRLAWREAQPYFCFKELELCLNKAEQSSLPYKIKYIIESNRYSPMKKGGEGYFINGSAPFGEYKLYADEFGIINYIQLKADDIKIKFEEVKF